MLSLTPRKPKKKAFYGICLFWLKAFFSFYEEENKILDATGSYFVLKSFVYYHLAESLI